MIFNIFLTLLCLLVVFRNARKYSNSFINSFFFYVGITWSLLSSLYLDFGYYSVDIDKVTSNNLSGIWYFVFTYPFVYIYAKIMSKVDFVNVRLSRLVYGFCLLVLILLFTNYILSPKPYFDSGATRINYWEISKMYWLRSFLGNISSFVALVIGFNYYLKRKKIDLLFFMLYLLYLGLIGQKGGVFLEVLIYFLTPFSVEIMSKVSWPKLSFYALMVFSLVFLIAYHSYSVFNPYSELTDDIVSAILYRILALQNALTSYAVDTYLFIPEKWDYSLSTLGDGMSALMNDLPNFSEVNRESQISIGRLTNAYPGNLFKYSAIFSPFILCLLLCNFYVLVVVYSRSFKNIGFSFIFVFQLFSMSKSALFMGDLWRFCLFSSIIFMFVFLRIEILVSIFYRHLSSSNKCNFSL